MAGFATPGATTTTTRQIPAHPRIEGAIGATQGFEQVSTPSSYYKSTNNYVIDHQQQLQYPNLETQ
jgi:hypothetical protein